MSELDASSAFMTTQRLNLGTSLILNAPPAHVL